jgi:outer membrane protein OmpA-like peptidoglycan-associated protein
MLSQTISGHVFALLIATTAILPSDVDAQSVLRRVKAEAKKRVADRKQTKEDSIVVKAGDAVDSTVSRAERALTAAVDPQSREARRTRAALADGRLILGNVAFVDGTAKLSPGSDEQLAHLAAALSDVRGTFLVESHVVPNANAKVAKALSDRRAAAVKAWLVAAGIPSQRLFTMGLGATRLPERIEIARMQ